MKETAKVMWCALVLVCVWTTGCKSTAPVEGSATQELTASASDETGKQDEGPNAEVSQPTQDDTSADLSSGVDVSSLPFYATGPVAIVDGEEITAEQFNAEVSKLIRLIGGNLPPHPRSGR